MANKTIHELNSVATLSSSDELAIYDVSGSVTGNGTIEGILGTNITGLDTTATNLIGAVNQHETAIESLDQSDLLYADDGQAPTGEVEFVSQDTELTPSSTVSVDLLNGNNSWSQRFVKISQMFKNIRYLLGKTKTIDDKFGNIDNLISDFNNDTFFKNKYSQPTSMMVLPFSAATTNQPSTTPNWGYCLLYFGANADTFKIYCLNALDEIYTRTYSNDSWGDWIQQLSNKVIRNDDAITAGSGITITAKQAMRIGNIVYITVTAHKTDNSVFSGRINPLFIIGEGFRARQPFNSVACTNATVGGVTSGVAYLFIGGNLVDLVVFDTGTANQKEVRVTLCYIA